MAIINNIQELREVCLNGIRIHQEEQREDPDDYDWHKGRLSALQDIYSATQRYGDELWDIPFEQREAILPTLSEFEERQLARGYACTADAVAEWLGLDPPERKEI